jgi:hypothetical protein
MYACMHIEPNPDTVLLSIHCNLWQHIEGGGNLQYCIIGNVFSETFMGIM